MLGFVRILTSGEGRSFAWTLLAAVAAAGPNRSGRRGNSSALLQAQSQSRAVAAAGPNNSGRRSSRAVHVLAQSQSSPVLSAIRRSGIAGRSKSLSYVPRAIFCCITSGERGRVAERMQVHKTCLSQSPDTEHS